MQTLPPPESHQSEARAVSEILAKANPAEMPAMRASLSFLTSAGAELATALAKRNREYDDLLAVVTTLPPEWIEAARTGGPLPDVGSLRAELELAKDERIDLHGQLVERDRQISALQQQLSQSQAAPQAQPAAEEAIARAADIDLLSTQLADLQDELDKAGLARAQAEDDLKASEAELNDIENGLVSLRDELLAALPTEAPPQEPATSAEEPPQDLRLRRAMRLGALAAAISTLVDRTRQGEEQLQVSNAKSDSVLEELEIVSSDRMALEADLQEKVQTLEDQQTQLEKLQSHEEGLNVQIEQLTGQVTLLQAELDNTLAAKAQAEEQLQLREGELAELNQQIDSVALQLTSVLPEDVLAQLAPAESEEPMEAPAAEGEAVAEEATAEGQTATRSAAPKLLALGALAAGVNAAVDLSNQKSSEAAEASGQLAAVIDEKTGLESALGDKELALADLQAQLEVLNAQTADVQALLDAALASKADLEQQLGASAGQVSDLEGQIQDAVSRLQGIVPPEDLPLPATPEGVEGEAGAAEGEAGVAEGQAGEVEGQAGAAEAVGLAALVSGVAAIVDRNTSSRAELDLQMQALQAQIEELSQEKTGLEATLEEKGRELVGYNDYALNLQGQVNELAAQVSSVEAALALKEQAEAEAHAQIESLTAQIESLTAQVADLQTQLDAANSAKAELQQTLDATQAQLETAQANLAQIDEESQRVLGEKAARLGVVGAGATAIAAIKDKEDELDAANQQVLALQKQVDDLSAERDDIVLSKDELQTILQARETDAANLRSQLEVLQGQMAGVVEERAAMQEQLAEVEESLGDVEAQRSTRLSLEAATAFSEALARLPAIKSHAASAAIVAGVQPTLSPRIQALTDVKGIGSAYQQRLYKAGIGTYWELASLPDADMLETLRIPELQRARIDFEETRADAYQWAQQTDTIGLLWEGDHVDDFELMPGIGKTFEKRLYEAGITTYEQLAACDVERLVEIVHAPPMREVDYDDWKARAQQLLAERLAGQAVAQDQPVE